MLSKIINKLKQVFTIRDWESAAQIAIKEKAFVVEPFITRLHYVKRAESQGRSVERQYSQAQGYPGGMQRGYSASRNNSNNYDNDSIGTPRSIHNLMEMVRNSKRG